ncbi:glycosyltransferase family 4 protein [bacterium]|nr:glycosyltransferase family 4 protein [bacterium]
MRVLMISLDKTLLGQDYSGDAIERHKEYARRIGWLDVIIFSKKGTEKRSTPVLMEAAPLIIHPTNSKSKLFYIIDAYRIGSNLNTNNSTRQKQHQKLSPNLIVTQDPFLTGLTGWLLKRKFKIPLLVHFHGDFWENKYWIKEKWYNFILLLLSKFIVKRADGIRVVSSGIKRKLIKAGISKNKIRVIPTPVDLQKFEKCNPKKVNQIREKYGNKKIVLFVGRLSKEKNLPMLLKAAFDVIRKDRDVIFLIIGKGKEKEKLLHLTSNLKLQTYVKFLGCVKHEELVNYYHACEFIVLPSFSESFGKVLLEAGASGKPAVATSTTGAKEIIIDRQTGFLVPINDEKSLAKCIVKLLQEENLVHQMGQAAKEHILSKFNPEKTIQKMTRFWKGISH